MILTAAGRPTRAGTTLTGSVDQSADILVYQVLLTRRLRRLNEIGWPPPPPPSKRPSWVAHNTVSRLTSSDASLRDPFSEQRCARFTSFQRRPCRRHESCQIRNYEATIRYARRAKIDVESRAGISLAGADVARGMKPHYRKGCERSLSASRLSAACERVL